MTFQKVNSTSRLYTPIEALVSDIQYHNSYHMLLEEPLIFEDNSVGKILVFGFWSGHLRMRKDRSTSLDNKPLALMIRKFTPTGKIAKQAYYWYDQ